MAGRKHTPTVLEELHGRPGKRPLPKHEPMPTHVIGDPPHWLSEEAQASWTYAVDNAPKGLLTALEAGLLTLWCVAESTYRQAYESIQARNGRLVRRSANNPAGVPVAELAVMRDQAKTMIRVAMELGFTPTARPKIKVLKGMSSHVPGGEDDNENAAAGKSLGSFLLTNPDRVH